MDITRATAALLGRLSSRKVGAPDEEVLRAIALYASPQIDQAVLEAIKEVSPTREVYVRGWLQLVAHQEDGDQKVLAVCSHLGYQDALAIRLPENAPTEPSAGVIQSLIDAWGHLPKKGAKVQNATKGSAFEDWVQRFMLASTFFDGALPQFETLGTGRKMDMLLSIRNPPLPGLWKKGEPLGFCLIEAKNYDEVIKPADTDSFAKYALAAKRTKLCKVGLMVLRGTYDKRAVGNSVALSREDGVFLPGILNDKSIVRNLEAGFSPDQIIQLGFLHMADAA